jgi:type IV secretion system protein TrbL
MRPCWSKPPSFHAGSLGTMARTRPDGTSSTDTRAALSTASGRPNPLLLRFFYVMGGSLVFLFLTWHIPSVAGSMMAGAVSLSLADALVPGAMTTRASGTLVHSGALLGGLALGAGRWGVDRLRVATTIHTAASLRNGGATTGPSGANERTGPPPQTDQSA